MAPKNKRRRPNAGPPPVRNPRYEAKQTAPPAEPRRAGSGRTARDGMPQPMAWRGIVTRALVAAAIFFVYILLVSDLSAAAAFPVTALAFVLMVPAGFLMDRAVYRIRLRRWHRQRGGA